jgi:hypothetical protein
MIVEFLQETKSIRKEEMKMAKRKAQFDAVEKYSKTPKKNLAESEFSAEFSHGESPSKGANRNSKLGKKGRS